MKTIIIILAIIIGIYLTIGACLYIGICMDIFCLDIQSRKTGEFLDKDSKKYKFWRFMYSFNWPIMLIRRGEGENNER